MGISHDTDFRRDTRVGVAARHPAAFPSYNFALYALNLALSRSAGGRVVLLAAKL